MKKLTLLMAVAASFSLAACSDDKPAVVHETRVVHVHQSTDQVNVPQNNSPDNFQAVERPAHY